MTEAERPANLERRSLWAVLLVALALRMAVFVASAASAPDLSRLHTPDTQTYLQPAESLLAGQGFARQGLPEILRTPGYPVFLLPGIATGHVEFVTALLQMVLSLVTVWLVYRLTLRATDRVVVASLAALFAATDPVLVVYSAVLLPETLFTCLVVLMIMALVEHAKCGSWPPVLLAAALLAAATLVRPVSYYLLPVLGMCLLVRAWRQKAWRAKAVWQALAFGALCAAPLLAWQGRNLATTGYPGFAAISAWNMYFYQGASVVAFQQHKPLAQVQSEFGLYDPAEFEHLHPELCAADQATRYRFLQSAGSQLVRQNLWDYAQVHALGVLPLLVHSGLADGLELLRAPAEPPNADREGASLTSYAGIVPAELMASLRWSLRARLLLLYSAAMLGLWAGWRRNKFLLALLVLLIGYFVALSAGPTGGPRLRHPLIPPLCVLAGLGCGEAIAICRRRRSPATFLPSEP